MTVVVSIDERVVSRIGRATSLGNEVALQIRRAKVDGRRGDVWLREALEAFCDHLSPAWGAGYHAAEYDAKVMSDGPGVRAVGRDFGRYLPGLFWLNFFGRPYVDLLGQKRLLSTPANRVARLDDGVLVQLSDDPRSWNDPDYAEAERRALAHLGRDYFFSKQHPDRAGIALLWD